MAGKWEFMPEKYHTALLATVWQDSLAVGRTCG